MKIIVFILSFSFCSCASLYVPNKLNVPLMKEKGDVEFDVGVSTNGFDFQSAWALHTKLFVMGNLNAGRYEVGENHKPNEHILVEGGIGYRYVTRDNFHINIVAGYGEGYARSRFEWDGGAIYLQHYENVIGQYRRYFIQPSFSQESGRIVIYCALRGSFVEGFQYKRNNVFIASSGLRYFIEPAFGVKWGNDIIKLHYQTSSSLPLNKNYRAFGHRFVIGSIGVSFNF